MAHWQDEALIDRGFAYVARATVVQAAVMALQSADSDGSKLAWARMVLGRLPEDEKTATEGQ